MPAGRPTDYDENYHPKSVFKLCLLGLTDKEMADYFEIAESTFHLWKLNHPKFSESITRGKTDADAKVARAMYQAAIGYKHKETKFFVVSQGVGLGSDIETREVIKQYPPDMKAAAMWLSNRTKNWRNRTPEPSEKDPSEAKVNVGLTFTIIDPKTQEEKPIDICGANEEAS